MSFVALPWLSAIAGTCLTITKQIWDAIKSRALLVGVFFQNIVAFVWKTIKAWGVYKWIIYGALLSLILVGVRQVVTLLPAIRSVRSGWQALLDLSPGLAWLLWDDAGPIRLVEFFRGMGWTLSVWITIAIAKWTLRTLRFNIQVALNMKLKEH